MKRVTTDGGATSYQQLLERYKRHRSSSEARLRVVRHQKEAKAKANTPASPLKNPFSSFRDCDQDLFLEWNRREFEQLSSEVGWLWTTRPLTDIEQRLFTCGLKTVARKMEQDKEREKDTRALQEAEQKKTEQATRMEQMQAEFDEMRAKMEREKEQFEVSYRAPKEQREMSVNFLRFQVNSLIIDARRDKRYAQELRTPGALTERPPDMGDPVKRTFPPRKLTGYLDLFF